MRTLKRALSSIGIIGIGLLGGCATMSADQCSTADWLLIGEADGAAGQTLAKAERRASDCLRHDVVMDRRTYDAGRHAGLASYCTPGTAYQLGESGRQYNGVCQDHDESAFLTAYRKGQELHAFTSAADHAADQLASAEARHEKLDDRLDKYWGGYRDEDLSTEEHNTLVLELWSERKYLAETAIPYWQDARSVLSEALDDYRGKVALQDPSVGSDLRPPAFTGPAAWEGPTREDARAMLAEVFGTLARASGSSN